MEEIISKIKAYAIALNPELEEDALLDFTIGSVVDRALIYTNRQQLVERYEMGDDDDQDGRHHRTPTCPIPAELHRALAMTAVGLHKTMATQMTATNNAVRSVQDNGQAVTYSDAMAHYLASADDASVFTGTIELLKRFRLPSVHEIRPRIQKTDRRYFLRQDGYNL